MENYLNKKDLEKLEGFRTEELRKGYEETKVYDWAFRKYKEIQDWEIKFKLLKESENKLKQK